MKNETKVTNVKVSVIDSALNVTFKTTKEKMATFLGAEEFKRNTRQKKVNLEEEVELISDSGKYFKDFFFCMVCFQNLI